MMETQLGQSGSMYSEWGLGDNMDELKEMVLDSNPYLFGLTMIVSVLHSLFEFLALKNGINSNPMSHSTKSNNRYCFLEECRIA